MGFFNNETELDINYKKLIKTIKKFKNIDNETKNYLVSYITEVKDGNRNNDFFDFEFLNLVVLGCLWNEREDKVEMFKETIDLTKSLLPFGASTEEYEEIKNMIINSERGINFLSSKLYPLFRDRLDYVQIVNAAVENSLSNDYLVKYAFAVSPFCINQMELKNEILSFIYGTNDNLDDINLYIEKRINEVKQKCGIYQVDEKTLALISSEAKKAQALIRKLDVMQDRMIKYEEQLHAISLKEREEISRVAASAIEELKSNIEVVQKKIERELEEYLKTLEINLKNNSDQVFSNILNEAQSKIKDIRLLAQSLSNTTTQELLRIKKVSEESVDSLKKYVENEPQLQKYLKEAASSEQIKEALLKFSEINKENLVQTIPTVGVGTSSVVLPFSERIVVPAATNVILPNNIAYNILPAFDESISFDKRLKKILKEKQRREEMGEIFHPMIDEVIICLMEGDWVYLYGPSGCGKSYVIKQAASLLGIDMVENGKITDKYSIMAYNDPHGRFRATQAFVACTYGKLLSLDEFDNGNPDTQVVLNGIYSGLLDALSDLNKKSYITFAEDMTVAVNPNFRMISAGNTTGEGENSVFSSRGKIDESVLERMTPKKFDYDNRVEQRIFGDYTAWYNLFVNFRKSCDEYATWRGLTSAPGIATTRDAASISKYVKHNSKSVDQILMEKFIQIKDADYLNKISSYLKKVYGFSDIIEDINVSSVRLDEVTEKELAKKLIYKCDTLNKNKRR